MTEAPSLEIIDLSTNFGVIFWAFVIATALFGISVVQGYLYFIDNDDRWTLRLLVTSLLVLDTAATILVAQSLHYYLVQNFGNTEALLYMPSPFIVEFLLGILIAFVSQMFYAYQIYKATIDTKYNWVFIFVILFSTIAFGFGLASFVQLFTEGRLISKLAGGKLLVLGSLYDISAGICDIIATVAMCTFLVTVKTSYKRTKSIINYLLFFAVNRGVFVALTQLAFFGLYLGAPTKSYWLPFHLSVSKLHINTLRLLTQTECYLFRVDAVAMLNSRAFLRSKMNALGIQGTNSSRTHDTLASGKTSKTLAWPQPQAYDLENISTKNADSKKGQGLGFSESQPSFTNTYAPAKKDCVTSIMVTSEIDTVVDPV